MGYKYGQRKKRGFRARALRILTLVVVFVLGAVASAAILLHLNDAYSLTGVDMSKHGELAAKITAEKESTTPQARASNSKKTPGKTKGTSTTADAVAEGVRLADCGTLGPIRAGLADSGVPQLRQLAEYEQVCDGAAVARASFFVGMPADATAANSEAAWVAGVLQEFSRRGIAPLVFLEPVTASGTVNFTDYRNGAYDTALDAYFKALQSNGVTDAMMGTWVPFPEANIPVWKNVNASDFAANVTKTVQIQKKYFPGSRAAILLESKTYPSGTSWEGGKFVSLLPYVQDIPDGLIDSFGLQGFAWPPTSEGDTPILDPKVFLRVDLAAEAARNLGATELWLNTGTFAKSYVVSRTKPFTLSPAERQTVLNGIVNQAKAAKAAGFSTAVHLFAEDKSALSEGIDWSYWPKGQAASSAATGVFKTFVHDLRAIDVPLWLFDSAP